MNVSANPPIRAVIFDNDGTLVDSEAISLRVWVELLSEFGFAMPHDEAVARFSGQDLHVVIREVESEMGRPLPSDILERFRSRQLPELERSVRPVAGVPELLDAVTLPFCVASNAPQNKIRLCLDAAGIGHHFEPQAVFSAYDIEAWKPKPDLFLQAARAMGVPPAQCAVVEDSVFGLDAAEAAGMQTFAYDPHDKFHSRDSVVRIRRMSELTSVFS